MTDAFTTGSWTTNNSFVAWRAEPDDMTTVRRFRFVHGVTAWLLATLLVLVLLGSFSYELFFVLSLIGFLVVTELTAPFLVTPRWRRRLRWPIAIGLVIFALIVARRIYEILSGVVI